LRRMARRVSTCQAPFEAAADSVFEVGESAGWPVGAEDQLAPGLVESVERVKEFFEDLLFAFQELHVIEEKNIDAAVARLEFVHALTADAVDEVVDEVLGAYVADVELRVQIARMESDCL
jgi:hypothetical protein